VDISVRGDADFPSLRPEWEGLAEHAAHSGAQTFDYAFQGWIAGAGPPWTLRIITARVDGRLMGVWALFLIKQRGVTIARQLGCGSLEEYASPLMAADAPPGLAKVMLDTARGLADVLEVWNLPTNSPMVGMLNDGGGFRVPRTSDSPTVSLREPTTWDEWLAGKSKSFRSGLRQDRRRLEAIGRLTFREITQRPDVDGFMWWLLVTKRRWLDARGLSRSWLRNDRLMPFYQALLGKPGSGVTAFSLELDGQIVAGCICLRSANRLEYFVTAFDPTYAPFSPGNLLLEDCVRWCIPRRLDFDFRMIHNPYKLRWADRFDRYEGYSLACTWRGSLFVLGLKLLPPIRAMKRILKPIVRPFLERARSALPPGQDRKARRTPLPSSASGTRRKPPVARDWRRRP
jgi:CelD/BcsL family acetyltransferase involved in cellulose biosynthesis